MAGSSWSWLSGGTFWLTVGFTGQAVFTARFVVQWAASEKKRDSVVPVAFWWLSLLGGATLLSYAIHQRDPVIVLGQGMGLFVYVRNLMLVSKGRRRALRRRKRAESAAADALAAQAHHPSLLAGPHTPARRVKTAVDGEPVTEA